MRDLTILLLHFIATVFRLAGPGGLRAVVAESILIKHQLLIVNRSRRRAPNLRVVDRLIAGAKRALKDRGHVSVIRVPGAFEIPLAAKRAALSRKYDGVVALGWPGMDRIRR